jgi:hypothetical protein
MTFSEPIALFVFQLLLTCIGQQTAQAHAERFTTLYVPEQEFGLGHSFVRATDKFTNGMFAYENASFCRLEIVEPD